jgi:hypothetical protein
MSDLNAPIGSWPFWRASIIVTLIGGVIGLLLGILTMG